MATTTKSTKAKSKTSKAKSTKSSSAKAATKSTTKKVTKPAAKVTIKSSSKAGSMTLLQKLYALSIAVYVALAGAAYMLMNHTAYSLSVGYLGKDQLASSSTTVFAPATQGVADIQIRYIVIAVAVLSLIMPVLYLTRLKDYHKKSMKNKVLPTRWIEMAVVVAVMVETAAILSGVFDIGTLKLVGGLMAVTCVLGLMAEKRTAEAGRPATAKYYLSMVTGLLPWVLIAFTAASTYIYGEVRTQWFVYAIYAVLFISAGMIGSHQLKALKGDGEMKDYNLVERNYAVLSLAARTAFCAVLIIGLTAK